MSQPDKKEPENANDNRGCWGCLITFGVCALIISLSFGYLHFHNKKQKDQYMKDPFPARKEVVEGFAGIDFPPYRVKETIMGKTTFFGDYCDTIKLEFDAIPDSMFFDKLDKVCNDSIHIEYPDGYMNYHFWYTGKDGNYHVYFSAVKSNHYYDTIRNVYISRGVPADFIEGVDRFYSITISKDTPEWTVIVGIF